MRLNKASSFCSSCNDYDKKANSSTLILGEDEISVKFRFGLDDLLKYLD